jgi:hypothetical protein
VWPDGYSCPKRPCTDSACDAQAESTSADWSRGRPQAGTYATVSRVSRDSPFAYLLGCSVRNVLTRLTVAAAAAVTAGLIGLAGLAGPAAATDDDPYAPKGGWPTPTCGGRWHPCTTSPPATTRPPRHTTPPPVETTPPPPPVTTQPPPAETTPPTTVTRTRTGTGTGTETTNTTPPPPAWTEPQLPVTGARPAVVGWSVGGGIALIAAGIGLWLWARRRRDLPNTGSA